MEEDVNESTNKVEHSAKDCTRKRKGRGREEVVELVAMQLRERRVQGKRTASIISFEPKQHLRQ